jgi:hypothetical protein
VAEHGDLLEIITRQAIGRGTSTTVKVLVAAELLPQSRPVKNLVNATLAVPNPLR